MQKISFIIGFSLLALSACSGEKQNVDKKEEHNMSNIVVYDRLMWQNEKQKNNQLIWKSNLKKGNALSWDDAIAYCEGLTLGGYDDWRVSSKEELLDLYKGELKFSSLNSTIYWTSTEIDSKGAWIIRSKHGDKYGAMKSEKHYVRCVRDK